MLPSTVEKLISRSSNKTFLAVNFGCRVNAAETNQFSQILLNSGFTPSKNNPGIIIVNTCSVTKKGDIESRGRIKTLSQQFPSSTIIASGCARLEKIRSLPNVVVVSNLQKEKLLQNQKSYYSTLSPDTMTQHHRFQLKVQSGCTTFCSYCIVPYQRPQLWSLPLNDAVDTVNQAISQGFIEIVITGVNLAQYQHGLNNLLELLLAHTTTPLISFGSLPIPCIDQKLIDLCQQHPSRLSPFLHIPIQSGSDKILKLMRRPYDIKTINNVFNSLKNSLPRPVKGGDRGGFLFGTDIIVGFPGETDSDFQQTYDLCHQIGFTKIHTFRFSPRPGTAGHKLFESYPKIPQSIKHSRSRLIRSLTL